MVRADPGALGSAAEDRALAYLQRRGLGLLCRNFRCRSGEIDLVMTDGDCLVFVEVRLRGRNRWSQAAATVGPGKQARLVRAAESFTSRSPRLAERTMRFDVLGIDRADDGRCKVEWLKDAFRP